jgi:hypothetical protein
MLYFFKKIIKLQAVVVKRAMVVEIRDRIKRELKMLPIVDVPETISEYMKGYRDIFCRGAGFDHVCRYIAGLILSPNKTLQGIHDHQVWDGCKLSRRSMHEAVFESGWDSVDFMKRHREVVSGDHQSRGREVIVLDWTLGHHDRGPCIYGVKKSYDYVEGCYNLHQIIVTAVISNRDLIDGIELEVQKPGYEKQEKIYLESGVQENYEDIEKAQARILELLHYRNNQLGYKKRTEITLEIVKRIEEEGCFPTANYAFDNGVIALDLTRFIESCGKHWVSEVEKNRKVMWRGKWYRADELCDLLKRCHPEGFRKSRVRCRNGEIKDYWTFTQVVRLRKYGRKRLVISYENDLLTEGCHFLITDARHWESTRILETWSYRWSCEIFHEFGKQLVGLESAQVRNEEPVKRHLRLSCVSQSILQRTSVGVSKSEKFEFAKGKATVGQRQRSIVRETFNSLLTRD